MFIHPTTRSSQSPLSIALLFLALWLISGAYLFVSLKHGWVPHDEGILGQSAERVLNGELPHRDFHEPYTGGLAYLDAAAFRFFGINLMVLRYVLFAFFLLWVPALFGIALEIVRPLPAAAVSLLSVAWSVPNYPAAMPSWYCLFFATFGVLALLRYLRSPNSAWLFAAGICGGLSVLVKTPGAYYVAAVLLFLNYLEQGAAREPSAPANSTRPLLYQLFLASGLASFLLVLVRVAMPGGGPSEFLHFVMPSLAVVAFLLLRERFPSALSSAARFRRLFLLGAPFLSGVILPLLAFCFIYWRAAALPQLAHGLFVLQLRRLSEARLAPPHWIFLLGAIPLLLFLFERPRRSPILSALKVVFAALLFCAALASTTALLLEYNSYRSAFPLFVLVGLFALYRREAAGNADFRDPQLLLLLVVSSLLSLVQVPYAGPLYFCYFAAFPFFAVAAFLPFRSISRSFNLALATSFLLVFAVAAFRPVSLAAFELDRLPRFPNIPLTPPRAAGLRVFQDQADLYDQLIPFIIQHSAGRAVFAAPDCPQIYFLTGFPNRTAYFFDFFESPGLYRANVQQLLDRPGFIQVAVLNETPGFSKSHLHILMSLVPARFPHFRRFGNFEVFWRD